MLFPNLNPIPPHPPHAYQNDMSRNVRKRTCILGYMRQTKAQNEQRLIKPTKMACAPSEKSDKPRHAPSLIKVFAVRMMKACIHVLSYIMSAAQRLIRHGGCPGVSESSLGAHAIFLGFVMRWLEYESKMHKICLIFTYNTQRDCNLYQWLLFRFSKVPFNLYYLSITGAYLQQRRSRLPIIGLCRESTLYCDAKNKT